MKKLSVVLSIIAALLLTGCSRNANNDTNTDNESYYALDQSTEVKIDTVLDFTQYNDRIALIGYTQENLDSTIKAFYFDLSGLLSEEIVLSQTGGDFYEVLPTTAAIDYNGNIWVLFNDKDEQTSEYRSTVLVCWSNDGEYIKSVSLGTLNSDILYSMDLIIGKDGNVYINTGEPHNRVAYVFDENGTLLFELDRISQMCELSGGRIIAEQTNITGDSATLYEIDTAGKGLGKEYELDSGAVNLHDYYYYEKGFGTYDILICTLDAVYGYNIDTKAHIRLLEWLSLGISQPPQGFYRNLVAMESGVFCLEKADDKVALINFTLTDAGHETQQTKVITLGALYSSDFVRNTVATFNRDNDGIEIQVKLYNEGAGDNRDALTAFNLDLIAGNIPDIIVVSPSMQVDSYASKGLFADLYEFIDSDADISRDEYVLSVLKLLETDGKLYTIADSFVINTLIGRVSDVGRGMGWTWTDYHNLLSSCPEGTIPIAFSNRHMSREGYIYRALNSRVTEFVDYEAGVCHFDTPDFISLLDAASIYPTNTDEEVTNFDFLKRNPLLMDISIRDFSANTNTLYEAAYFDEEFSYVGYPTDTGTGGSGAQFENKLAIWAHSDEKDAAWEFIKYIITDYQHKDMYERSWDFALPIRLSALEGLAQEGMNPTFGKDGVDLDGGFHMRTPDENDIQKIYDLINSLSTSGNSLVTVYDIIMEEAPSYYNGQRTAEDVARIIQSRVSLYLAEMSG